MVATRSILLLEAQIPFNGLSNLPVEIEAATFDAIRFAVDSGMVVVEAAGNGSHDLDTVVDSANRQRLNRSSSDFRDSGAILVGAASSSAPHSRLSFSNFGRRIDCYAWGENINTTGDGWMGTSTMAYTTSFGGTSGASPMIAASCLLMQSWRKKVQQRHYDPAILRDLLSLRNHQRRAGLHLGARKGPGAGGPRLERCQAGLHGAKERPASRVGHARIV